MRTESTDHPSLRVFYDGACPLCRKEISVYQRADRAKALDWCDVSDPRNAELPLSREALLARFHVQRTDGQLVSGARGFIEVWRQLPGWRWLAFAAGIPGMPMAMEWAYRGFLRLRPAMQRLLRD
ncbi:MAG: thiol-disulfide oxidoreductase DCC family protein [Burkholderiaceae bacterium]